MLSWSPRRHSDGHTSETDGACEDIWRLPPCKTEAVMKLIKKRLRDLEEILPPDENAPSDENEPLAKRAKTAVSNNPQYLTAESLWEHTLSEGRVDVLELMDLKKGPGSKGSKRSAASGVGIGIESIASTSRDQETTSQATQKSSFAAAHYRNFILKGSNMHFQFRRPPEDIRTQITAISQLEVSRKRKEELSVIEQKFHDDFVDLLDKAAREDDCVELFYQALSSMGYNESLTFPRKADWQPSLKPRIRRRKLNFGHLYRSENEANKESIEPPSKRHQRGEAYPSPKTSGATITAECMQSPPIVQSEVKTPRPDISIGLKDAAVNEALQSKGLTEVEVNDLLNELAIPDPRNGDMPLLCSEPTRASLQIRFPFFLVEGKSYATCRTIYEAQNQAAVSGACSLKTLHDLDDLVCKSNPGSSSKVQPIVFSVCTEGSIHQLWVHYTTTAGDGDGDRMYYMTQVKTCDVGIGDNTLEFLEAVDNVLKWGTGKHKEAIAEQLITLWQHSSSN